MKTRPWILALSLVLLAAPLAAPRAHACEEEGGDFDLLYDGGGCLDESDESPLIVREGAWLESELDSTWTLLEPGAYLMRLKRPTGAWIVETWYYRLPSDPTRVLTHDELADLRAERGIEPWDEPTTVVDQVLVYAQGEAQALRLARAMRPARAPARVVAAVLERALLEADESGC